MTEPGELRGRCQWCGAGPYPVLLEGMARRAGWYVVGSTSGYVCARIGDRRGGIGRGRRLEEGCHELAAIEYTIARSGGP